jgi:Zn-finger nucleic acid-binding protein
LTTRIKLQKKKKGETIFMTCPKCNTEPLAAFIIEGVTVDRCPTCAGVWFDARELSQLLSEEAQHVARLLKGSVSAQADGKKADCPRDASRMMRVYSSMDHSVILDVCGDCRGVWLDGGEFEKLFAARRR